MRLSNKYEKAIKIDDYIFKKRMRERRKQRLKNESRKPTYNEQLNDVRWFKKREEVFKLKGRKCSICGSTCNLQIHHTKYLPNRLAWEYKMKYLIVLCRECHKKQHNILDD